MVVSVDVMVNVIEKDVRGRTLSCDANWRKSGEAFWIVFCGHVMSLGVVGR